MMTIRPVSDLRHKFPEIEDAVLQDNEPVFLTKNGYGTMVLMSIEQYSALTDAVEKNWTKLIQQQRNRLSAIPHLKSSAVQGEGFMQTKTYKLPYAP